MNAILEQINSVGLKFVEFALPMFVQSVVLIVILLLADFALRKKVRAVFRYWIWLLVLVKLVLPTSLSSPMSLGYFFGDRLTYVDTAETPEEPQASLAELAPVNVPPFIDLTNIEADRFTPAAPQIIPEAEPAVTSPGAPLAISVTPLSWQGAVFLVWLTVVMAMILLLLQRVIFVGGLVAQAKQANGVMAETLESCRISMSLKIKLGLKISANAASPAVCGLFRPVILVPQNLASSLTADQLRAVLLHELAHIRRGDLFVNLAQTLLQIIYFYNPLLWLANCIIRRIREQAVDEMVLVAMGEKAPQYPQTLVSVAKLAFKRPVLSLRLTGVVESKSALSGRIKHILNRPLPKKAKLGILGLMIVIVTGAILLPMANSMTGRPELVIKGVIKDARTNEPIAGARVFDDGYGPEPVWETIRPDERSQWGAITNEAGRYSFLTWPEHHTIKVEAPGYKAQSRSLYKGHFVFNKKDQEIFDFTLEPEEVSDSSEFKTTLPNGVTVELIGVCDHPSEGKQWWRPDGSKLGQRPFEKLYTRLNTKREVYELALKIENPQNRKLSIIGKDGHVFNVHSGKIWGGYVFSDGKKILNQSIGIAQGSWETIVEADPKHTQLIGDFVFSVAFESDVEGIGVATGVTLTHTIGKEKVDYRVIAIDQNNNIHTSSGHSEAGGDSWMQTTVHFKDLRIDEIKEFQFQTRPYDWVNFKNVSLKPNFKTDVQVKVEETDKNKLNVPKISNSSAKVNDPKYVTRFYAKRSTTSNRFEDAFKDDQLSFEEMIGFIFKSFNDGSVHVIDFDTNRIIRTPDDLDIQNKQAVRLWAESEGVDAIIRPNRLTTTNMAIVWVNEKQWGNISTDMLKKVKASILNSGEDAISINNEYSYYVFKSSDGRIGVVGLFFNDTGTIPRRLLIKYKLLKTDVQVDVKAEFFDSKTPASMVGTWFFENPGGDDEQMAVFPDGRIVVLYSNGHKDESRYSDGFIELAESEGKYKMTVETNGTLVQHFDSGGSLIIGKRWKRIDPQPRTDLLRLLTGPNSGKPAVHFESGINWVIEDYGQTRLLSDKEVSDTDNWVSIWASSVKNKGRYLVPDRGLTLKDLIKAAGYNRDKLAESYVELVRRSREANIPVRSTYSRNLKTLLSGEESDIVIKNHDAVSGGYIEPSVNGVEFWSGYHFNEIVEMTVNDDGAKVNMYADLDTGKFVTPPDTLNYDDVNAVLRWIKDNGIDVMGETAPAVHGLIGFNMYAARVDNYFWNAGPQEITDRLMVRIDDPVLLSVENLLPVTYLIKTSKYKMGILQILGFVENPKGIKIRYKLLNKEAAPKSDVRIEAESVSLDWQYIGQSIPPDFNDTLILAENVNLGSIGHDAEGKTFITFVRDGQETQNSQYRFVLFTKDGDILEPDGHFVLGEGKRLEEKFTFDEPFTTRRLKGFRFQSRPLPPSGFDNISSQLQKPASEVVKSGILLPSELPPPGRYAVELDGVDDYLVVPDSPSLRLEPPFTIEMWVKTKLPPDASEYRGGWALISKGFTVGTPRAYLTGFGINLDRFPKEPSNLHITYFTANNSGTYGSPYSGYPLTNGVSEWLHITHVFDGDHYKSTPGHPLVMGKFLIPTNGPFRGLLGEVRLWNGSRTRQELSQYENVALTGNEPGLAACWTFEQTEGQYAYDITGNNNHARLGKSTGPDDADPKWVDLQAPPPQPDQKNDLQLEAEGR